MKKVIVIPCIFCGLLCMWNGYLLQKNHSILADNEKTQQYLFNKQLDIWSNIVYGYEAQFEAFLNDDIVFDEVRGYSTGIMEATVYKEGQLIWNLYVDKQENRAELQTLFLRITECCILLDELNALENLSAEQLTCLKNCYGKLAVELNHTTKMSCAYYLYQNDFYSGDSKRAQERVIELLDQIDSLLGRKI